MDIELYGLRIFHQVMLDKTFSKAARSLKITQPTVSQQIAKLEHVLQGRLFERVGHDLIPTQLAQELLGFAVDTIERLDGFSEKLQNRRSQPKGLVRYSMPESCQWTPHYRRIMRQIAEVPDIRFKIDILPNEAILKQLVEGQIDFGFVVGERVAPELRFQKFSDEVYSAVAQDKALFKALEKNRGLRDVRWVTYPGWEQFFSAWAKSQGLWKSAKADLGEAALHIGTLAGAIHAIQEGAGVGVIPTHCVSAELQKKQLFEWKVSKAVEASHPVYIARRVGEALPKRVELVIGMLLESKKSELPG